MRLEKITLNGFKSFADKTEFNINSQITGIVGPNGCGKSNVVDAIKWVLGNQSPKSLRSGQMADVIFSGSSSRKASGMAEVSLCFSEVSGLDVEQGCLEIARRLYRNGDSEYLINNKPCRLRDIRELFMDTGVGVSAYSIIEQGQIDQLLHKSTVERRTIFEEAAGISKFKAYKKEAIRKLERTEQNLLRLADIVGEVEKRFRSIKLQAGKARNYLKYSEDLKKLRVNYSLAEYDKIVRETSEKREELSGLEDTFGGVAAEVAGCDARVGELGREIISSEGEINRWDNTLVSAKSRIEQQYERIDLLRNRLEELAGRRELCTAQIDKLNEQNGNFERQLRVCRENFEANAEVHDKESRRLREVQDAIEAIVSECGSIEATLDDEKSGIIDIVRRTAQLHNAIQSMSAYRDNLNGQKDRLKGRASAAEAELGGLLAERAQHSARLEDITKVLGELQESLDNKRGEMARIDSEQARVSDELTRAKERRSGLASEQNVLSDMEARRQGVSGTIREILEARENREDDRYGYVEGIVADIISADAEHAMIVEAALEGRTDALVVKSTGAFLADGEVAERLKSRVKVICMDKVRPFADKADLSEQPRVKGRVVEFVKCQGRYAQLAWDLLGRTILVDSIDAAMELAGELGGGYRFVTVKGEVFDGEKVISVGPVGQAEGLISRKSRLHQIEMELEEISGGVCRIEAQMSENNRQNVHLERLCKNLRTAIYEANTEKVNTESAIRVLSQDIKRISDEQPVIASEIDMLAAEMSQSVQKEYESKQKLEELEAVNEERTAHIQQLEAEIATKRKIQESRAAELTEVKVLLGQISEQQKSINQQIASLQSQLQHGRTAIESARMEMLGCDEQILQSQRMILKSESQVNELFVQKEEAQKVSVEVHEKVEKMVAEKDEMEVRLKEKRAQQADIEQRMHEAQLVLSQLGVRDEELAARVRDELQIDIVEAYKDFEQGEVDWEAIREEIADLRSKIERLGNVNVDAIKEQDELEERFGFLTGQVEDLDKSKGQLEQLIAKINKESQEKFQVMFNEVRENFQVIFRKLFGGGKADIYLEDAEDILECGIEIVARPPGKETRTISLLSGGEKTMTAIALLFAVFKSKPSPFCVLDEVDAALDEANNERFNLIVQEFKEDSQFVVITHSKRTMSIADVLFGITMQTQGVSKKISVQFDNVDAESDAVVA